MLPTRRNRHSRRIASAANFSSAVQMMIKCYCARENGKEDSLALLSGRTPWAPALHSKACLTPCVLGISCLDVGYGECRLGRRIPALGPCEPAQVQRALGRESGVQVATPTWAFICCSALDLSFHSSNNLLLLPYHRNMELQRPWSLSDAWDFSDRERHSRLMKQLKQGLEGLGTQ